MKIELRPLSSIVPYDRNPRKNDSAVDAVATSLQEFGFRQPIVVDTEGVIVVGHTRYKAAQKLGLAEVPVHVAEGLTAAQVRAYRLADNKTNELAEWDFDLLPSELQGIEDDGFAIDWSQLGFDAGELDRIRGPKDGLTDPDEVPEAPVDLITKPGDLWILGEHRLLCGDSTKAEDVARIMDGAKADLCLTDPPYGVDYVGKTENALRVYNDGKSTLRPLLTSTFGHVLDNTLPGACWYVAAPPGPQFYDFATVLNEIGVWRQTLVWVKQSLVMGHSDYHYQHEALLYGWTPGGSHKPPADRKQTTVWNFDRPTASREHPTMKPVSLFAKAVENSSLLGSLILDPFLGSGTTLIAAEQLGRRCFGMDIAPQYVDVAVKRWEQFTGRTAERAT